LTFLQSVYRVKNAICAASGVGNLIYLEKLDGYPSKSLDHECSSIIA
jgi:hypothetical protein